MSINKSLLPDTIVSAITSVAKKAVPLHAPEISGNEWIYVKECLDTGWVSSAGKYVEEFEERLMAYTGAGHAICTVNGTSALHSCLIVAGVGVDDEVIVPSLSFVATSNAVAYCGAIPNFCDSSETTLGIDPFKLKEYLTNIADYEGKNCFNRKTGRRVAAVVCMHTYGHPVMVDELLEVCRNFGLPLIEDAAESLGSIYKGKHTGNSGLIAALSFNGNKVVSTGGGGAILTNDSELAAKAKHLTTTAKIPHAWEFNHDAIGFNYRMPNINAAMGCAQIEQLPDFLHRKRILANKYAKAFASVSGVTFFNEPNNCKSNYWLNVIILDKDKSVFRDEILSRLNKEKRMSRPAWRPNHQLPMFSKSPHADLSVAESLYARLINIPSSPSIIDSG